MVKLRLIFLAIALFVGLSNAIAQNPELVEEYINKYRELAMSEQMRVGIPAAVTLAQGIHETGAGTSRLAKLGNNHFGIKCKRSWKGQTIKHTDDAPNECFRKYNFPLDSYKDHSNYLRNNPRYASLFKLSITDYAAWCIGLRRAGYATNPRYAQMLIKLIENYKLQEYTYAAMGNNSLGDAYVSSREDEVIPDNDPPVAPAKKMPIAAPVTTTTTTPVPTVPIVTKTVSNSGMKVSERRTVPTKEAPTANHPAYGKPIKVNGLRAVYGKEGQAPLEYAIRNSIRYKRFLELNEMNEKTLPQDMYLYLERKHFRGVRPMHMVKPGETMHVISQKEGMQLKYLRELNYMLPGEEPVPGIVLELQNKAKVKPRVYEAPKKIEKQIAPTRTNGYVKTNKSPIPTNPRYVAPSKTVSTREETAIKVTTSAPPVKATTKQPVAKQPEPTKVIATSSPKLTTSKKENEDITALKKQFDNVIYDKQPKKGTVATNPRYVPKTLAEKPLLEKKSVDINNANKPKPAVKKNTIKTTEVVKPVLANAPKSPITTPVIATSPAAKPIVKPVLVDTKSRKKQKKSKKHTPPVEQKVTKPISKEEPKSELDKLKAQFDAVVYDSPTKETKVKAKSEEKEEVPVVVKKEVEKEDASKYYTVEEGDTAFSIAKKHNISMTQLMNWNDLDFGAIKTGMKLQIKK